MACAQDNENQSSDETYISKEDFCSCIFVFNMLLAQRFFQTPFLTVGRGWLQTGAAPQRLLGRSGEAGRERLLADCCALTNPGSFSTCRHTGCLHPGCTSVSWARLSPKGGGWDPYMENGRGHSTELRQQHVSRGCQYLAHTCILKINAML